MEFYKNIIQAKSCILEIGSGTGRLAIPLLRENIDYHGLEISKELCDFSKQKINNRKAMSAIDPAFTSGTCDKVSPTVMHISAQHSVSCFLHSENVVDKQ